MCVPPVYRGYGTIFITMTKTTQTTINFWQVSRSRIFTFFLKHKLISHVKVIIKYNVALSSILYNRVKVIIKYNVALGSILYKRIKKFYALTIECISHKIK